MPLPDSSSSATLPALRVTAIYAVVSGLWIALSDGWVARIFSDPAQLTWAQTMKGWFFVAASSVIIFVLVRRAVGASRSRARVGEHLRIVLDTIPAQVYWKDRDQILRGCNAAFARQVGTAAPETLVGTSARRLQEMVPFAKEVEPLERTVLDQGAPVHREEVSVHTGDGGEAWYQVTLVPLEGEDGGVAGVLVFSEEVTTQKRRDAQLRHAQKIQALGEVTSGVAHDLKNVLSVIQANVNLLEGEEEESSAAVADIRVALGSAVKTVGSLLAFGRRSELEAVPLDLTRLIGGLAPVFSRILSRACAFHLELEDDLPLALADSSAVEQALLNVLTNARDALVDGGEIRVALELTAPDTMDGGPIVTAGPLAEVSYLCLSVTDSGRGMSREVLNSIFTPFFTTKPRGEGTGLGMSMVADLMQAQGGGVQVLSALGKGTTVRLLFPLACSSEPIPELEPRGPALGSLPTGSETILVVDDQPDLLRVTGRVLERHGYRVLLASDGTEALQLLENGGRAVDLILSDLVMPKTGGLRLFRSLRSELKRETPFVLVTGLDDLRQAGATADEVAALPLIGKPWTSEELLEGVRDVLQGGPGGT